MKTTEAQIDIDKIGAFLNEIEIPIITISSLHIHTVLNSQIVIIRVDLIPGLITMDFLPAKGPRRLSFENTDSAMNYLRDQTLEIQLQKALLREDYEQAARLKKEMEKEKKD